MPAWTAFGVKSRTRVSLATRCPPAVDPQPAATAATASRAVRRRSRIGGAAYGRLELAERMRRRVTFSRNLTLSLSRTCRCYCKYCAFATHKAHLYSPEEVERILDHAARRNVKELLVLTGEKPEHNAEVGERLHEYGHV